MLPSMYLGWLVFTRGNWLQKAKEEQKNKSYGMIIFVNQFGGIKFHAEIILLLQFEFIPKIPPEIFHNKDSTMPFWSLNHTPIGMFSPKHFLSHEDCRLLPGKMVQMLCQSSAIDLPAI